MNIYLVFIYDKLRYYNPLSRSCFKGHVDIVKYLIKRNCSMNCDYRYQARVFNTILYLFLTILELDFEIFAPCRFQNFMYLAENL